MQKIAHKKLLFLHHRFDLYACTPLQSIYSSNALSILSWLVHLRFFPVCLLQALASTTVYYSFSSTQLHTWAGLLNLRPPTPLVCCNDFTKGMQSLLAPKPKCYGACSYISVLQVLKVGT